MTLVSENKLFWAVMCSDNGLVLLAVLLVLLEGMARDL